MRPVTVPAGALHSSTAASAIALSGSTEAFSGVCGDTTATPGVITRPDVPSALTLTPVPCNSAASPVVNRSSEASHS